MTVANNACFCAKHCDYGTMAGCDYCAREVCELCTTNSLGGEVTDQQILDFESHTSSLALANYWWNGIMARTAQSLRLEDREKRHIQYAYETLVCQA
jgi:hypothetical protein